jgi:uncharacterized protein YbjT (DUF2867 family)
VTPISPYKIPQHVLLTGATGYIGKRLIPALLKQGIRVTCLIRHPERGADIAKLGCDIMIADLATGAGIGRVPTDIDVAYFLVHAMNDAPKHLIEEESTIARHFIAMLRSTAIEQIIYLSGLANHDNVSPHLKSRLAVETILNESGIPTTTLRSSIIIGSGSASFEIIRDLVEKLPIMVPPKWIRNRCQPISIVNVIEYLLGVIHHPKCYGQCFDIGGPDVLTFRSMLLKLAKFRGLRRWIVCIPLLSLRMSSLWLYFITSTNFSLSQYLVESMKEDSVCNNNAITGIVPISPIGFDAALKQTFSEIDDHSVLSSWRDSWHIAKQRKGLSNFIHVPTHGCFIDQYEVPITNPTAVIDKCWAIGGQNGWYFCHWLWQVRGFIDKCVGGVGLSRGRTHQTNIHTGDALDFWRVIYANKSDGRLLLFAEMKLPGDAWLEWKIQGENPPRLVQTATFRPNGIFGRLYWYAFYVVHFFMFKGLAKRIANP